MYREAQRFLQRYVTSPDFRILLVDSTTRVLVEQLVSSDQLQKGNVCLILDIGQAGQLSGILQQDLAKIVCVLSPASVGALIGVLNANYLSLGSFRVLFTGAVAIEQLGQLQISPEKMSIPSGFQVLQTNMEVRFSRGVVSGRSLDQLVGFYLAQASRFQTLQAPAQVTVVGRDGLTDFQSYRERLKYLATLKEQAGTTGEHLVIVDRGAFLDSYNAWEMRYEGFLRRFSAVFSALLAVKPPRDELGKLVKALDEFVDLESAEVLQRMNSLLQTSAKVPVGIDALFSDAELIKLPFGEAAQRVASQIQRLNAQEQEIKAGAKIQMISQHEREKETAQMHLTCQLFLAEFGRRTPLKLLVDVSQKMRASRKAASDVIQMVQGKPMEHLFPRVQLLQQFLLSQENAAAQVQAFAAALGVEDGKIPKPAELQRYQPLLVPQGGKLSAILGDSTNPDILDALTRTPKHPFDPVAVPLYQAALTQGRTVLVNGPLGCWEPFDGEVCNE